MAAFLDTGTAPANELVIERVFNAPRELVFQAWTDLEHIPKWFGPKHHPATHVTADLRPGGRWRGCLRSPETGVILWLGGVYREIVPPERLVFTFAWRKRASAASRPWWRSPWLSGTGGRT